MILIIDNYDSFTQNLAQYVGEIQQNIKVIRNNHLKIKDIENIKPSHILLSPGPGHPQETQIALEIIQNYSNKIPILGVCLGHQCIGYVYGGQIEQLENPYHGKVSEIKHNSVDIFKGLPNPLFVARYHSLIIKKHNLPPELEITAWTEEGIIMGCRHKKYKMLRGIQFHPESIWTNEGKQIIKNFLYKKT